jgi:hypothetical protein
MRFILTYTPYGAGVPTSFTFGRSDIGLAVQYAESFKRMTNPPRRLHHLVKVDTKGKKTRVHTFN